MRHERINWAGCEAFNHCPVYFCNFAIIDITTEQNIPDKMGGYQYFCVNKDARTIVFIKKVFNFDSFTLYNRSKILLILLSTISKF